MAEARARPSVVSNLSLALRLARREMRGGLKGFRIFLVCLALGVAAISGVGSLSRAIVAGLEADGAALLGGDVELRLTQRPPTREERDFLDHSGEVSVIAKMRAMAYGLDGEDRSLVELKAVDGRYPLYGEVSLDPPLPVAEAIARRGDAWGAAVDRTLLDRFGLSVGDRFQVGGAQFEITAVVVREPDRGGDVFSLGPRVLAAEESLAATGLIRPGSLVRYHARLRLPAATLPAVWTEQLKERFPKTGWRIRSRDNGAPGVRRFVERIGVFLALVGLSALVVGGVGVGNAVKSYLSGKTETIAVLKCLGATGGDVGRIYVAQVMFLALLGIGIGLGVGVLLPLAADMLLAGRLPVAARFGVYPGPLVLAAGYGVLTALAFTLWPLGRAREVPPAGLFRDLIAPQRRVPGVSYGLGAAVSVGGLAALAVATTADRGFALWFVGGVAASFLVLWGASRLVSWAARRARRSGGVVLRLALGALHRPGAATLSVMLSMGVGLTLLAAVALIEGNLAREIEEQLPERAPAFFFVDIQQDQIADFERVALGVEGVSDLRRAPSVRGRIVEIAGVPVEQVEIAPDARWAVRGDRVMTYANRLPENNVLTEGAWWPGDYDGPPLLSLDSGIARGFGVEVGDTLTLNILGREMTAHIGSLRRVDWSDLSINHVIVFAPGTLERAPHTHTATINVAPRTEDRLFRAITDQFRNVTVISVKEALATIDDILGDVSLAGRATALVTLVAGMLVLAGAVAAGHRGRVYDAVVIKVLGATRRSVLAVFLIEYMILGTVTAAIAGLAGTTAAYLIVTRMMDATWTFLPGTLFGTLAAGVGVTIFLGLTGTWRVLGARPAGVLRAG
ncbi:MAG: FtsX-like permease family protein [Rhodospirillales bacterium]|nr:FtsX-like permease family protein [Rhodospirillales bacterium]